MPRLVINPNTTSAWEIQLKPGTNLFGRGFANDFKIENPSVSSSHCQIVLEAGRAVLRDLGSTNGTFVNRSPVTEAVLQPGQTIHLGAVEILFQGDSVPLARPAETEMIPRSAMPSPIPSAFAGVVPRGMTPVGAPSLQAAEAIPVPPPPTNVATQSPPRAPGISLAARPAPPPRPMPVAAAPMVAPPIPHVAAPAVHSSPAGGPVVTGGGNCKFHPKTMGRYLCSACNHYFCELCIASRHDGPVQHKFCRQCGAELTPVKVKVAYVAPKGFFSQLPGAFVYPVKGAGVLIIIAMTIFFGCLNFFSPATRYYIPRYLSWTLMVKVLAIGYLFAFMQSIIHAAAIGEEEMPSPPGMGNLWEDILLPCLQFMGLLLICFGPAMGAAAYMIGTGNGAVSLLIAALIFGMLYFPMAFLAVAMLDSVMAANPIQIIPSIAKVPLEYFVTCIFLAIVFGLPPLGDLLIPMMFPHELGTKDMGMLFGYLATEVDLRQFYRRAEDSTPYLQRVPQFDPHAKSAKAAKAEQKPLPRNGN